MINEYVPTYAIILLVFRVSVKFEQDHCQSFISLSNMLHDCFAVKVQWFIDDVLTLDFS